MFIVSIFLLICFTAFGSDLYLDQKQACGSIKLLNTDDSAEKYLGVAQLLHSKGLSTCACLQHFMQQRKLRVQKEIQQNFGIKPDFWKQVEADANKIRTEDAKNAQIEFEPNVSKEHHEMLIQAYGQQRVQVPLIVQYPSDETKIKTKVERHFKLVEQNTRSYYKKLIAQLEPVSPWMMTVENTPVLKGQFLHELKHVERNHSYTSLILKQQLKKTSFSESPLYEKFKRYHEAEADRLPAACGSCDDAQSLILQAFHFNYRYPQYGKSTHPSTFKRCEWAYKIMMLKEAEEKLKKEVKYV